MSSQEDIPSESDIFEEVKIIVAEELEMKDEDQIQMDSTIVADLGAESIDHLGIVLALERTFDIGTPKLNALAGIGGTGRQQNAETILTERGYTELNALCSDFPFDELAEKRNLADVVSLLRVRDLVSAVRKCLSERMQGIEDENE